MKSSNYFPTVLILFLLSYTTTLLAQLELNKASHDFGSIDANSNRTVDFTIVNHYQFSVIMTGFYFDMEVNSEYSPITLKPNDTLLYRVKIFPYKTGDFHKTIQLKFYNLVDTIHIDLYATVLTTKFTDTKRLEPIEEKPNKGEEPFKKFPVSLLILDGQTGVPVKNASVSFSPIAQRYKSFSTGADGRINHELNNRYEARIYASGYRSEKYVFSLGCDDSIRTVYLKKSSPDDKTESEYFYEYEGANPIKTDEDYLNLKVDETESLLKPLSEGNYRPNNIVFLLDISISMIDHDRINLLKRSITQLVSLMRPEDYISIITFSEDTQILIQPTFLSETNRTTIVATVNAIKAGGMTNGGKGLKLAYKLMQANYDPEKNNQVLLATDGALGAYMKHEEMVELVERNNMYTKTSVVTLNGYNWSKIFMQEIATAGNGKIITINSELEAQLVLVKNIKENSIIE